MDEAAFLARFVRSADLPPAQAHPGRFPAPTTYPCTWERFGEVLSRVGGTLLMPQPDWRSAVQSAIDLDPGPVVAAQAAHTHLQGMSGWTPAAAAATPTAHAHVGLAVLFAECAVAENAAVLLTSRTLPERALGFLAERLLVLVPANALIGDFITAQTRLAEMTRGVQHHHLTWMSGPSKTADIEQCLVIGAHSARALTVVPIGVP